MWLLRMSISLLALLSKERIKLITKKYSESDYADAANYFLGVLTKETDKKKAKEYFINYINDAPNGKYSLLAIKEIISLNEELSQRDYLAIGASLLKNEHYKEAIEYLDKVNIEDSWGYLTVANKKTGNNKIAKQIFLNNISKYSKNGSESQQLAVEDFVSLFRSRQQGLKEAKTICDKSKCKLNDYIMYNLISFSDKQTKLEYYNRIYEEFPDGKYAADALFNSEFYDYLSGKYDNAIIKGKKHQSKYSNKKSAPAALYWLAKSYDKKRNISEANNTYSKIYNKYSDSYYGYLSSAKINKIDNPYNIENFTTLPEAFIDIDLPILHANLPINSTKKIEDLLEVKDFKIFEYADFENEIVKSWVAYYEGDLSKASVIAEKIFNKFDTKPTIDDDIYKLIYPIGYSSLINKYGVKAQKISPYLLLSLIRKESRFNKNSVSSVGAIGLMQLMPDTAKYISSIIKKPYDKSKLFDSEYNINLGTNYYNYIKTNHHSEDVLAIASYNSGHGAVSKWINLNSGINKNNYDEFVEKIPYPETKDYVKQIYQNYWMYTRIYNSSRVK